MIKSYKLSGFVKGKEEEARLVHAEDGQKSQLLHNPPIYFAFLFHLKSDEH